MADLRPQLRVGISGWTYPPWRGNFYPHTLPQKLELPYASRRFNALEVNGTFYSLQTPSTFQSWYDATPHGFLFTLKGGRYLTHMRRLRDPLVPLANYLASGLLRLRDKLGPILWQFPPNLPFNEDRFKAFFDLLPHTTLDLAKLARKHDPSRKGKVELTPDADRPVRHAVEFRHESFLTDRFTSLLRRHNIALTIADVASKYPTAHDITADFTYIRLHGSRHLYASGYTPREIKTWAKRVELWHAGQEPKTENRISPPSPPPKSGRDIFLFFDNTDVKLRAPVDATRMMNELGLPSKESPAATVKSLTTKAVSPRKSRTRPVRP